MTLGATKVDAGAAPAERTGRRRIMRSPGHVRRFAVLDDDDDELDELPLFQPTASTGLSEKIAKGLAAYLLEKTDKDMRCNRIKRLWLNIRSMVQGHKG